MTDRLKHFKPTEKKYSPGNFKTARRHKSPSPKRSDYEKRAVTKPTKERCIYIDPETNKRCRLHIGIYPKYCHIHTTLIENLYVAPSGIKRAGNGLFAGPLGFRKNEIIGEYSKDWMKVKQGTLDCRNGKYSNGECKPVNYSYIFCDEQKKGQKDSDVQCWDGLDKNSTIVRNANDAHGSKYHNNAHFETRKDSTGKTRIYMIASTRIAGLKEVLVSYGPSYF
jgi:hypothetical protein